MCIHICRCQGKSGCEVSEKLHVVSGVSLNGCPNRLNTVDIQYSCYNRKFTSSFVTVVL